MTAHIRVYNDGPESVDVMVGGRHAITLKPGAGTVLITSRALSFEPVRPMTPEEESMHTGMPARAREVLGRVAEDN